MEPSTGRSKYIKIDQNRLSTAALQPKAPSEDARIEPSKPMSLLALGFAVRVDAAEANVYTKLRFAAVVRE